MKRRPWILLVCLMTGCSTHPCADFCDFFKPGKLYPNEVTPYGGVAIPQGPITPVAPNISVGPPSPLAAPPLVPPPAPLPGNAPPPPFSVGDAPPPFPPNPPPRRVRLAVVRIPTFGQW